VKPGRSATTFGALREARVLHVKGVRDDALDYDGEWRYAGRGYVYPESNQVAETLLEASPRGPQQFHTTSTNSSTTP
jgi:hypothetical protein